MVLREPQIREDYFWEVNWISLFRLEINDYLDQHIPDQARIELHLIILKNTSYIHRCVFIYTRHSEDNTKRDNFDFREKLNDIYED